MNRVLMLSFQFPPMAGSSGVQRCLRFAQDLPALGWQPLVLTAHPRAYGQCSDDLLDQVPAGLPVRRAFALDAARHLAVARRYPGWLARPDRWTSWVLGGLPAGLAMIRRHRPQLIWSTYPIPSAHLLGDWLARLSGLPWVADFRDPMAHQGYPADPVLWQSYARLERRIFRRARRFTFTTPGAARLYAQRFPQAAPRIHVIENGYTEAAFQRAEALREPSRLATTATAPLRLLHSGVVYPEWRSPDALFAALAALQAAGVVDASRLRLQFRASGHDGWLREQAQAHGVAGLVDCLPPLPYDAALAEMMDADALLLLQSRDCNDQIPAKAYEYLRAGRPVLSLADPQGDTGALMRRAGLPHVAALEDAPAVARELRAFLARLAQGDAPGPDPALVRSASRQGRAAELAGVLAQALNDPPGLVPATEHA